MTNPFFSLSLQRQRVHTHTAQIETSKYIMGASASRGQDAGSRPASALVSYYCAFACPLATRNERAKLHPASLPGFYFPSGAKRSRIRIYPCVRSFATKDYNVAYTAQRGRSTRHNKQASVFLLLLFLSSLPPIRFFLFFSSSVFFCLRAFRFNNCRPQQKSE